ncbi:MAG TPA: hypothetical protein VMF59_07105 [Bacteroidota bacterium]|nr:hypothetical protein [Bacteroidota bacterium]
MSLSVVVVVLQLIAAIWSGFQESGDTHKSSIRGWTLRAFALADYEIGIDHRTVHSGMGSGFVEYTVDPMVIHPRRGPAYLLQAFKAGKFAGKRVRLTAFLKSERAGRDPFLWMHWEGGASPGSYGLTPAKNADSSGWVRQECVVDIPQSATVIAMGASMGWRGTIWLDDFMIEIVGDEVPLSGEPGQGIFSLKLMYLETIADVPVNPGFED